MRKQLGTVALVALPLLVGGFVYAAAQTNSGTDQKQQVSTEGYICPLTGEELPCPNCCPINGKK